VSTKEFAGSRSWPSFSSPGSTLADAAATGRLEMLSNATASRIIDATGPVELEYVDTIDGTRSTISARALVLCASTIESVRLLLNSASTTHPRGIGNHSDLLGRGLMDHCCVEVGAWLPASWERPTDLPIWWNGDGLYLPRYRNVNGDVAPFQGGYGVMVGAQRHDAFYPGSEQGLRAFMVAFGEVLPYRDNRITVRPDAPDRWGIPTPHLAFSYRANEDALLTDAAATMTAMFAAAGCNPEPCMRSPGGLSIHEVGGAAMGTSPASSVTDPWGRIWSAPNIIVGDGATWPTSAYQNPTLTMMAMCRRATLKLADELA
jgi:choline dehydrogenase-like flavoprotein